MADDEHGRVIPDEERARQILEQLKSVHTFDLAYETMVGLVNFGSQKMGLLEETRVDLGREALCRLDAELCPALLGFGQDRLPRRLEDGGDGAALGREPFAALALEGGEGEEVGDEPLHPVGVALYDAEEAPGLLGIAQRAFAERL